MSTPKSVKTIVFARYARQVNDARRRVLEYWEEYQEASRLLEAATANEATNAQKRLDVRARAAMSALEKARHILDDLEAHQPIWEMTAPIYRLPTELVVAIFQRLVDDWEQRALTDAYQSDLIRLLATIGTVSRAWREALLSTPRLWRNIHFYGMCEKCGTSPYTAEECLQRSGRSHLSIWAQGDSLSEIESRLKPSTIVDTLTISAAGLFAAGYLEAPRGLNNSFLTLSYLHLDDFESLPDIFVQELNLFPALRTLSLARTSSWRYMDVPTHNVTLPHLRVFRIQSFFEDSAMLLSAIFMPKLKEFQICWHDRGYDLLEMSENEMLDLKPKPLDSVTNLFVASGTLNTALVAHILASTPAVEVLSFNSRNFLNIRDFAPRLRMRSHSDPEALIPRLRIIRLSLPKAKASHIVSFVGSFGQTGDRCLETVAVHDRLPELLRRGIQSGTEGLSLVPWDIYDEYPGWMVPIKQERHPSDRRPALDRHWR